MNDLFALVPILLIIGGIVSIVSPKTAWYLQEGWKYKRAENLEPSDAALLVIRIGGVVAILFSLIFIGAAQDVLRDLPPGFP